MILNPSSDVCKLDCYPDADFSEMYVHELPTDTAWVNIRTGFVITFANFPIYWASRLQTETELSTIESEINALSHSYRELLLIIYITTLIGQAVGLPIYDTK